MFTYSKNGQSPKGFFQNIQFQRYAGGNRIFVLHMLKMDFPNATINENWIRGHREVKNYVFDRCNIKIISSLYTEFGSTLDVTFTFRDLHIQRIRGDAFQNYSVEELHFKDVYIDNFDLNILVRAEYTLRQFTFVNLPSTMTLDIMFGAQIKFPLLTYLSVGTLFVQLKILKPSYFSALFHIEYLDLSGCYIHSIEIGTFDQFSHTLERLDLSENRLQTILPQIFNQILDRDYNRGIGINLHGNDLICDCTFIELDALSTWGPFGVAESVYAPDLSCKSKFNGNRVLMHTKCDNIQVLSLNKRCGLNGITRKNAYPTFYLTLNMANESLLIRTTVKDKYRIWMYSLVDDTTFNLKWGYSMKKCPAKGYLETASVCLIASEERISISVKNLLVRSSINLFCISYVHGGPIKKFWPLHCITHGNSNYVGNSKHIRCIAIILIVIFGFVGGLTTFILSYALHQIKQKPNIEET